MSKCDQTAPKVEELCKMKAGYPGKDVYCEVGELRIWGAGQLWDLQGETRMVLGSCAVGIGSKSWRANDPPFSIHTCWTLGLSVSLPPSPDSRLNLSRIGWSDWELLKAEFSTTRSSSQLMTGRQQNDVQFFNQ